MEPVETSKMQSISEFFLDQINEIKSLKELFVCMKCSKSLENTVRVKVCDHYFCEDCLDENKKCCPKCSGFFEIKDVVTPTVYVEGIEMINNLENLAKKFLDLDNVELHCDDSNRDCDKELNPNTSGKSSINEEFRNIETTVDNIIKYGSVTCEIVFSDWTTLKRNSKGETPLHISCKKKNFNVAKQLIESGTDLNAKDFAGWTPLHEAIESLSIDIVKLLIKNGAQLDIPGPNYITPLHKAVSLENKELIQILLESGANLNVTDYYGRMPLNDNLNIDIQNLMKKEFMAPERKEKAFVPKKMIVYCHTIDGAFVDKLKKLKHSVVLRKDFDIEKGYLTHLIVKDTHKLSFKIILSLLQGLIIVPQEWIDLVVEQKLILPLTDSWTILKDKILDKSIKDSLVNNLLNKPKLFDGLNIFIERHNKPIKIYNLTVSKDFLKLMVTTGGGNILHRAPASRTIEGSRTYPFHAPKDSDYSSCSHYIIFDEENPPLLRYDMQELKHRSSRWLIDCVRHFRILPSSVDL